MRVNNAVQALKNYNVCENVYAVYSYYRIKHEIDLSKHCVFSNRNLFNYMKIK